MKRTKRISLSLLILGMGMMAVTGCKKKEADPEPAPIADTNIVKDIDGNTYHIVKIGEKYWMKENLRTTKYRNGEAIVQDLTASWTNSVASAYCYYDGLTANAALYGNLYNYYSAADLRNVAPQGWHVATAADWQDVIDLHGGEQNAGGRMKEKGNVHWDAASSSTDTYGFSALPGGIRTSSGAYARQFTNTYWWMDKSGSLLSAACRTVSAGASTALQESYSKSTGMYVRCVKD